MRLVLTRVGRGLEITAAATVLLLILTLHHIIIRNTFTLLGIRSESPLLFMIEDGCGAETLIPAALRDSSAGERKPIPVCEDRASFRVTAKSGMDVMLFVNGRMVQRKKSQGLVDFTAVQLRSGLNEISVSGAETKGIQLGFPFPSRTLPLAFSIEGVFSRISTSFGLFPELPISSSITVEVPQGESPAPRLVRTWQDGKRGWWRLYQGPPGGKVFARNTNLPAAEQLFNPSLLLDGFFVRSGLEPEGGGVTDLSLRRTLEISKKADGLIQVSAGACLPEDHPYARWSRDGTMDGPEFVARLYGTQVANWLAPNNPLWQERRPMRLGKMRNGCLELSTTYSVPGGHIRHRTSGSFPELPGDELVLTDFDQSLKIEGRPADEAEGSRLVWRGSTSPGMSGRVALRSSFWETRNKNADSEPTMQKDDIFATWCDLVNLLPKLVRATLWGLATAAPVALMWFALDRYRGDEAIEIQVNRTRAGVMALFALMIALALHPMLVEIVRGLLRSFHLTRLFWDPLSQSRGTDLYASMAFLAVFMVVPLFQGSLSKAPLTRLPWRRCTAAVFSLALLTLAFFILRTQHLMFSPDQVYDQGDGNLVPTLFSTGLCEFLGLDMWSWASMLGALVGGWCIAGLAMLWVSVYWLYRVIVFRGPVFRQAVLASAMIFLLPIAVFSLGAVSIVSMYRGLSFLFAGIAFAGRFTPFLIVTLLVTLFLRFFGHIAATMLAPPREKQLLSWLRPLPLLALAAVIVWPLASTLGASPQLLDDSALRFMTLFQSYGAILALFAPFGIMELLEREKHCSDDTTCFDLPPAMFLLLAAAFAGYLTLWQREPMSVAVLMGTGWVLFRYGLLDLTESICPAPDATLGRRLLDFLEMVQLFATRRKNIEKQFTDGGLSHQALVEERVQLQALQSAAEKELGAPVKEAKRRLLENGPKSSPLRNACLGAFAGLITAAVFQLLLPLDFSTQAAEAKAGWLALLRGVVVDPNYKIIADTAGELRLLAFVNAALNAVALWVVAGFLFGYAFHRIRGNDGFVKAVVFGVGLSVPYLLSLALQAEGAGGAPAGIKHLVPLLVFLLVLGAVVFDGTTLRRQGIGLAKLTEIYGFKTSIGYASLAGLVASVQPLLQLMDWISG